MVCRNSTLPSPRTHCHPNTTRNHPRVVCVSSNDYYVSAMYTCTSHVHDTLTPLLSHPSCIHNFRSFAVPLSAPPQITECCRGVRTRNVYSSDAATAITCMRGLVPAPHQPVTAPVFVLWQTCYALVITDAWHRGCRRRRCRHAHL